jgi:hypothetical protein
MCYQWYKRPLCFLHILIKEKENIFSLNFKGIVKTSKGLFVKKFSRFIIGLDIRLINQYESNLQ